MAEALTRRQIQYVRYDRECEWLLNAGRSDRTISPPTWQGSMFKEQGIFEGFERYEID